MDTLISDTNPNDWDFILLQEPYIYPNSTLAPGSAKWFPLYPPPHMQKTPRSIILVSASISSNTFEQIQIPADTITALSLRTPGVRIDIYNIYNPPNTNQAVEALHEWINQHPPQETVSMIWAGDFNKHNPMWTRPEHNHRCRRSDTDLLLMLLAEQHMVLTSPPGMLTFESEQHQNTWSTLDLVFCSEPISERVILCEACPEDRIPSTDHLPIHTTIDITIPKANRDMGRNFRTVNWEKFEKTLTKCLHQFLPNATMTPSTIDTLDEYVDHLTKAIQQAIEKEIPRRKPSPYSKRWWTPQLSQLRKMYSRLDRQHFLAKGSQYEEELLKRRNEARNEYNSAIRRTKNEHWKKWLEEINEQEVWTAGKYAKNPLSNMGRLLIPTLNKKGDNGEILASFDTAELKAQTLTEIFFPPKPTELPPMPEDDEPLPVPLPFTMPRIHQVIKRIHSSKPFKAPGNDGILNIVLQKAVSIIAPCLHKCLIASTQLKYFPKAWRVWTTVVLRKPGRPDYSIPKAYRPIALYNTMGKIVSGVMTDVAMYLTVRHSLLPARHFGGLPGRTTTDSLLYLTHKIKDAWRRKKVVTIIFLDIANAFPNAVTKRLLSNMRRLRYPKEITDFFQALLTDRQTQLSFDDFLSEPVNIDNGIGQGEPASMLLYLIYNHGLISIPRGPNENGGGYVDDTFFMAIGDNFEESDEILNNMLDRQEIWSKAHNSKAEVSKFQCLRLTRRKQFNRSDFIRTTGQVIKCVATAKLLGVLLDEELRWHPQVAAAVKKGTDLHLAICRLTRPSFGLPYTYVRRLVVSMVLPKVEYALPVWYTPIYTDENTGKRKGSVGHTKELARVQRLGCKSITGAFRCTATDVLDLHAFLPPTELRLESTCYYETLRLAAVPENNPLFSLVKKGARRQPKSHPSPIHNLFRHFQIPPHQVETLNPIRRHPNWQPSFTTHIAKTREDAARTIRLRMDDLQIFSDGSGHDGNIGSAAIVIDPPQVLQHHSGSETEHTVFESEVIGILLALQFPDKFPHIRTMLIALDNQAAIQALTRNDRQPGQYLLDAVHTRIDWLQQRRRRLRIHIEWVPGHENVKGNETADKKAKEAAQGTKSISEELPPLLREKLPASVAALRAHRKRTIIPGWTAIWSTSPRFNRLSKIDRSMPSSKFFKILRKLPRRSSSILTQLRTGHVALNAFLKKIKVVSTSICHTCRQPETVTHYLIHCKRYQDQRRILKREAGKAANSVGRLLSDPRAIRCTLRYIAATRRFKDYQDVEVPDEDR